MFNLQLCNVYRRYAVEHYADVGQLQLLWLSPPISVCSQSNFRPVSENILFKHFAPYFSHQQVTTI